jgi:hypothetical protein
VRVRKKTTTSIFNYGGRIEAKHSPYTIKSLKNKPLKSLTVRRPKYSEDPIIVQMMKSIIR